MVEQHGHEPHNNYMNNSIRAGVFGFSDGLVSNLALIFGVAGATPANHTIVSAGIAGLLAGAFSMAVGEFNSVSVQNQVVDREIEAERHEIEHNPEFEQQELVDHYIEHGAGQDASQQVAKAIMADPEKALALHCRIEFGEEPDSSENPYRAGATSFAGFITGAMIPLIPWFFINNVAVGMLAALVFSIIGAVTSGTLISKITMLSPQRSILKQVCFVIVPSVTVFYLSSTIESFL